MTLARRVMKARWPSTCPLCRGTIHVGNQIARIDGTGWVCITCVIEHAIEAAMQRLQSLPCE